MIDWRSLGKYFARLFGIYLLAAFTGGVLFVAVAWVMSL